MIETTHIPGTLSEQAKQLKRDIIVDHSGRMVIHIRSYPCNTVNAELIVSIRTLIAIFINFFPIRNGFFSSLLGSFSFLVE